MMDFNSSASVSGQITALIDIGMQRVRAQQTARDYLGASRLGAACERALQFEYAKAPVDHGRDTQGRMLRIFERGHVMQDCMVAWLPDAGFTIASGALLSLAGAVAEVALPRLPGLADQVPGSPLQQMLAPPTGGAERFNAFSSDYEPEGDLVSVIKDGVVDRIFGNEKNDLVVPSDGVATTPCFALPTERCVVFPSERSVHHSAFFGQPEMVRIADWLGPP